MIENLTLASLGDRVGESFEVRFPDQSWQLELIQVRKINASQSDGNRPFAAEFRGPPDPIWPQATYQLINQHTGLLDLFLVPVGPDDQGMIYEAVFN